MNDLLKLQGILKSRPNPSRPGPVELPRGGVVRLAHLFQLIADLTSLSRFWSDNSVIQGALVSVFYTKTIAKSNRIRCLLSHGSRNPSEDIVGAKFSSAADPKHIITYYVPRAVLLESIDRLKAVIAIFQEFKPSEAEFVQADIDQIETQSNSFARKGLSKTSFSQLCVDSFYVEKLGVPSSSVDPTEPSFVSLYRTGESVIDVLRRILPEIDANRIFGDGLFLSPAEIIALQSKAPYLIAMSDFSKFEYHDDFEDVNQDAPAIPEPNGEPCIGVLDTLFEKKAYFSDWVDFRDLTPKEIETFSEDYEHGTSVSSLIVDGPSLNPELDDGCGRFRVRHFGIARHSGANSFGFSKNIRSIVRDNPDIRVWNLSLGSGPSVNPNSISLAASELDAIQNEFDVVFVVAATNRSKKFPSEIVGSPADSINSLIVNSASELKTSATYARRGPILSFFRKPDISCFGGDDQKKMVVWDNWGRREVSGTSFAAPWIARKLSFLIDILGLDVRVAKALIIDSAAQWEMEADNPQANYLGYGVVPTSILDVVKSKDDEIRFFISGRCEQYYTYTYDLPVPVFKEKYPYKAKATLCYSPSCSRSQGVDYTDTELDLAFGRWDGKTIKTINDDRQSLPDDFGTNERKARLLFRKWDNIKHICETVEGKAIAKKRYGENDWAIQITDKNRENPLDGRNIRFGLVVTLKEINGLNRIDDFINVCSRKNWLVTKIDVDSRLDIFVKSNQEVTLD